MIMKSIGSVAVALAIVVAIALPSHAEILNRIVATIDGEPVTQVELERYAEVAKKRPGGDQAAADQKALLDELILDRIIAKQLEAPGLKASDQQIDSYIEPISGRNNLG